MSKPYKIELITILVLLLISYFGFNDILGLRAEEPRRAVVGMEVLLGDNALVPTIHGEPYYNKPPVYNWVLAASFLAHDSFSPGAVRLPGVFSICLIALLLFFLVKYHTGPKQALIASLVYLTFGDLFFYGSVKAGEIDLFYSLLVFLQIASVFHFYSKQKYWSLFLFSYFFAAVGVLTKGLPSMAFQALTILAYFAWQRDRKIFSIQHAAGISLFVLLVGGYFYAYSKYENAIGFMLNLWLESSSKSANEAGMSSILKALYSFPLILLQILLPWGLFLVWYKKVKWKDSPLLGFSLVFILANIWLYWVSPDLRNRYLYPFLPFVAIIISNIIEKTSLKANFDFTLSRLASILSFVIGLSFIVLPFTGIFGEIEVSSLFFSICGVIFLLLGLVYLRFTQNGILRLVLVIALLRFSYNLCILPIQTQDPKATYYAFQVDELVKISNGQRILWTGRPYQWYPALSFMGLSIVNDTIQTPPHLAYQIPYYYTLKTGERFLYSEQPTKDQWLLAQERHFPIEGVKEYYRFEDKWSKRILILYKIES